MFDLKYNNDGLIPAIVQDHFTGKVLMKLSGKKEPVRQSAWYEGSAVVYGKNPRYHIFQYSCYKYAMHYHKRAVWKRRYEEKNSYYNP